MNRYVLSIIVLTTIIGNINGMDKDINSDSKKNILEKIRKLHYKSILAQEKRNKGCKDMWIRNCKRQEMNIHKKNIDKYLKVIGAYELSWLLMQCEYLQRQVSVICR